jgi:hypothetical protein
VATGKSVATQKLDCEQMTFPFLPNALANFWHWNILLENATDVTKRVTVAQ